MIEKYEKEGLDEKSEKIIVECIMKEATHKHICYHDEPDEDGNCRPCKRIKL